MGRGIWALASLAAVSGVFAWTAGQGLTAQRSFDNGTSKVELIGVCRASETDAECWNPDGTPNDQLTADFRLAFLKSDYKYLPVRYGSKTRVAVFRVTNPPSGQSETMVEGYFQNNRGNFDFDYSSSPSSGGPRVEIRTAVILAKPEDTTGSASTTIRHTAKQSDKLPMKAGSQLEYLGTTYRIAKIVKSTLDPALYGAGSGRWMIAMTADVKQTVRPGVGWTAIDKDGLVIRAVDKNGDPVVADPNMLSQPGYPGFPTQSIGTQPRTNAPAIYLAVLSAQYGYQQMVGDDYPIFTNINPSKIKALIAYGSWSEPLTITGIPLEPKR